MPKGRSRIISKQVRSRATHRGLYKRKAGSGFGSEGSGRGLGYQPPTGLGKAQLVQKKSMLRKR
jgi:hypothetical protein